MKILSASNPFRMRAMLYGIAFLAVAFWGASFAATKIALRQLSPPLLVFLRTSIGIGVLALASLTTKSLRVRTNVPWPRILVLGFLGVAFHQWIQAQGLQTTSTTDTGWIIATIPIFVALLGWRFLGERLSPMRILGIGFGAFGVILVISDGHAIAFINQLPDQIGNSFILISAVNWAVFTVLSKRWLFAKPIAEHQPGGALGSGFNRMIRAMLLLMFAGWVIMLPWVAGSNPFRALGNISGETAGALLFLGVACSGLAYIFWYAALTRLEATETSALLYFEPLVTQAVAWFVLDEPVTLSILAGGFVILLGVWMVGRIRSGENRSRLNPGPEAEPDRPEHPDHDQ